MNVTVDQVKCLLMDQVNNFLDLQCYGIDKYCKETSMKIFRYHFLVESACTLENQGEINNYVKVRSCACADCTSTVTSIGIEEVSSTSNSFLNILQQ